MILACARTLVNQIKQEISRREKQHSEIFCSFAESFSTKTTAQRALIQTFR